MMDRRDAIRRIGLAALSGRAQQTQVVARTTEVPRGGEQAPRGSRVLKGRVANAKFFTVGFSPDGSRIVTGGQDSGSASVFASWVWDSLSGEQLRGLTGEDHPILAGAFSPDGKRVAVGGVARLGYQGRSSTWSLWEGGLAFVHDATAGRSLYRCPAAERPIYAIGIGSQSLATIDDAGIYRVFNANNGTPILEMDDLRTVQAGVRTTQRYWSISSDALRAAMVGRSFKEDRLRFAPPGDSDKEYRLIRLWDARSNEPTARPVWLPKPVSCIGLRQDGLQFATWSGYQTPVTLRDFETTKEIHRFDDTPRHYSACDLVTWSSDGRFLAIGNVDGAIRVWEVESGRRVLDTQGPKTHVRDLLFLGESIRVASGGIRPDPILKDPINRGPLYEPLVIWDAPFA